MITVYGVQKADAGFGQYQRGVEGQEYPEMDTVSEYVSYAQRLTSGVAAVTRDDEEHAQVEAADGATGDQDGGAIIGWIGSDGGVLLELVIVG